jgi:plasmid replication initiation protein
MTKPLLPVRHTQKELFLADIADAVLKDDMASMEHPIFSLNLKQAPGQSPVYYDFHTASLLIEPSPTHGFATIYDKDILIFAISQLMAAKNQGRGINKKIEFDAVDFLKFSNKQTGGAQYRLLKESLARLLGTTITTSIRTGGVEQTNGFHLIDAYEVIKESDKDYVTKWSITINDWLFHAIEANEVLTLHPDYFRLRSPLERRVYELARKHTGNQQTFKISLERLKQKTGSNSARTSFKHKIKQICETNHLPDYTIHYDDADGIVRFENRRTAPTANDDAFPFDEKVVRRVQSVAPGMDVFALYDRYRDWADLLPDKPKNPAGAFIKWCEKIYDREKYTLGLQ